MAPILFSVFGIIVVKCTLIQVLIFWLPMYLLSDAALKHLSQNIRTTKWTNIYETILFPSLIIPVLLETLGISQNKFAVTRKDGIQDDRKYRLKKSIPHIFFAAFSLIGIANCTRMIFTSGSPTYIVVLFWLVSNFYNILMSIFFMLGRKALRKTERFLIEESCIISYGEGQINCTTIDISEGGLSIILDFPKFIPYDVDVKLSVSTKRYACEFNGKIVQVQNIAKKWKYAFRVTNIDRKNFKQLLNIIYDRVHSLPKYLDKNNSVFDDLRVNLMIRNKKNFMFSRKLPRIDLNKILLSDELGKVKLVSFNYEYAVLKTNLHVKSKPTIKLYISKNTTIKCILQKTFDYSKTQKFNLYLYKIENYKELQKNKELGELLAEWICEYEKQKSEILKSQKAVSANEALEINEMDYL